MIRERGYHSISHQNYSYLDRGKYVEQIGYWLNYFDKEQFLFMEFGEFTRNTQEEMKKVYEFLDVSAGVVADIRPMNEGSYEPMNAGTRKKLKEYFDPYNRKLFDLLGREFTWE